MSILNEAEKLFLNIAQSNDVINQFKNHSMRVMFLASSLAKKFECYDEDLRIAALLHDIGKLGISKEILFKPGKLSEIEYIIVQSHCHVGNTIIRNKLGLNRAATFVRDHHERWDGSGYPRGLKGKEISFQGRIIGLCDAFDAMTNDCRNYQQKVITFQEGYEELERCAWSQFDGELVKGFIEMMGEIDLPPSFLDTYKGTIDKNII